MGDADDPLIPVTHAGVMQTDEDPPMTVDLSSVPDDGCGKSQAEEMKARGLTADQVARPPASGGRRWTPFSPRVLVTEDMARAISLGPR